VSRLNFGVVAVDNPGVDQVSRPMQIALVAVVLLAGMWFTVLKPKPEGAVSAPAPATPAATPAADASAAPAAPGTTGLANAVDKAKGAASTSDAANAKVQAATGDSSAAAKPSADAAAKPAATKAKAKAKPTKSVAAARKPGTKAATKKAAAAQPAVAVDPSDRLLAYLPKGKTLVILFYGKGADDAAARKAVHRTALKDQRMVSAYVPISKVGAYEAITAGVDVLTSPTVMVIGTNHKATTLTGFIEAATVQQAVGDARRSAAKGK
jgi:hypothetical protein